MGNHLKGTCNLWLPGSRARIPHCVKRMRFATFIVVILIFIALLSIFHNSFISEIEQRVLRGTGFVQGCASRLFRQRNKRTSGQTHVVYVRIPKTGSSRMFAIMCQYAWRKNLTLVHSHPLFEDTQKELAEEHYFLPQRGMKFDMMAEHVLFDKKLFSRYFYADTVYVTMLREPMSMLFSSLYNIPAFVLRVPGPNKLQTYLGNPLKYDYIRMAGNRSNLRNPQSGYLGLNNPFDNRKETIYSVISSVETDFSLVMILERFDESLVLLKRLLGWELFDVISSSVTINANLHKPAITIIPEFRAKYENLSAADHILYQYFLKKLDKKIQSLGKPFKREVETLRKLKGDIEYFCRFDAFRGKILQVPTSAFNDPFILTGDDCLLYNTEPLVLKGMLRKRQDIRPYFHPDLDKKLAFEFEYMEE